MTTTINWLKPSEVRPAKSGEYMVYCKDGNYVSTWSYSKQHDKFNVHDGASPQQVARSAMEPDLWAVLPTELRKAATV